MKKIKALVRKEILDILRDKKTLVMMVVVPMLLYPTLLIGLTLIMVNVMQSQTDAMHTAGIPAAYAEVAADLERLYDKNQEDLDLNLKFVLAEEGQEDELRDTADIWLNITEASDGVTADVSDRAGYENLHINIEYDSTNQDSSSAAGTVEELVELYQEDLVETRMAEAGIPAGLLQPVTYELEDAASMSESLGMDIGGSIGMMLIVTILLGAVYPAIDATAGEKERGTLETLLTLPVTNFQMIMSKFISVGVFACTTAIISILSLGGSVLFLIYGVAGAEMEGMQSFSLGSILTMLPVLFVTMIATALLISALCMCFCVFAKSFKEANNYVTPLLLVVMFASMASMIPSLKLDYRTALIPIVNVSLMVKQIISGQFELMLAGETILINFGYSVAIVWILAKLYDSEDILFSDGFRSFRIFQQRSSIRPGTVPAVGDLVISITVLFLLMLYLGTAVSVRSAIGGTALQQLLILVIPLLVLWYMKSDRKKLLSLHRPSWKKLPGSILLYIGTYALMLSLSSLLTQLLPQSTENIESTYSQFLDQPFWLLVLVMAVMPAIGEEILFRGFLFGSLRERIGTKWSVLLSALIFGAFHMSLVKLIPTGMLGAAFAWITASAGSIFVSMALHFLNNAISFGALKYPDQFQQFFPILAKEELAAAEVLILLIVGILSAAAGLALLRNRREK